MKLNDIAANVQAIDDELATAATAIQTEITNLQTALTNNNPDVPPAAQTALTNLQTIADGLKNIGAAGNGTTTPPTAPPAAGS